MHVCGQPPLFFQIRQLFLLLDVLDHGHVDREHPTRYLHERRPRLNEYERSLDGDGPTARHLARPQRHGQLQSDL
jgi:hypothetical protein